MPCLREEHYQLKKQEAYWDISLNELETGYVDYINGTRKFTTKIFDYLSKQFLKHEVFKKIQLSNS